MGKTQA
jgi:uncharacterized damage-inducible protein DinB